MKKELTETIVLIEQAIKSCGHDFATLEIRNHLIAALNLTKHVSTKRKKRALSTMEEMVQKGKSVADRWWSDIQENVRKTAEDYKVPNSPPPYS